MILHDGHRERLRQRILTAEPESLEPHELLEFLLYFVLPRQDVNALSHALLEEYGSLKAMFDTPDEILINFQDMGQQAVDWLREVHHYSGFASRVRGTAPRLVNYADVFAQVRWLREKLDPPCCIQLCADQDDHLLYRSIICRKRKWGDPETFQDALADVIACSAKRAYLVILTAEYLPMPGRYDKEKVRSYAHLLDISNCALMDVLMMGKIGITSMRRLDLIPEPRYIKLYRSIHEDYMRGMPSAEELADPASPFYSRTGGFHERTELI